MNISRIEGVYLPHKRKNKLAFFSPSEKGKDITGFLWITYKKSIYFLYETICKRSNVLKKQPRLCLTDKNTHDKNILKVQWKRINIKYFTLHLNAVVGRVFCIS